MCVFLVCVLTVSVVLFSCVVNALLWALLPMGINKKFRVVRGALDLLSVKQGLVCTTRGPGVATI